MLELAASVLGVAASWLSVAAVVRVRAMRLLVSACLLAAVLVSGTASAKIVERVVAVVGNKAILLSELNERAEPAILRIMGETPPGPERTAAVQRTRKLVLERLVDERLMRKAARKAKLVISSDEVDRAIANVARQNRVTVERLYTELRKAGMTERKYRAEMRRQLLEMKLLNLRLQGRLNVSEDDLKSAYRRLVLRERRQLPYRIAWIQLALPRGARARKRVFDQAEQLSQRASRGQSFARLARRFSVHAASRARGGQLAAVRPGQLAKAVDQVAIGLSPGEISSPFRLGNRVVIIKLLQRAKSRLPPFAQARPQLSQRLMMEKRLEAQQRWLEGMRRRTHVDVRL